MTDKLDKVHKLQTEDRAIGKRLGEIGLIAESDLTTEVRAEQLTLRQRSPVCKGELQAAADEQRAEQTKGLTLDAADTELRALTETANVGDVIAATIEQRMTTGATAEIQQHFRINSNQIPLEMLRLDRGVEERAAATVPGSIADATQAPVVTPIFASGDGAFLGIERPIVGVGVAAFPILGTAPGVRGPYTDSTEATDTDAVFSAHSLAPERLQARFSYRLSDASRFAGLDPALRRSLNGGLQEKLDNQAVNGSDGLVNGSNLDNHNVTSTTSFSRTCRSFCFRGSTAGMRLAPPMFGSSSVRARSAMLRASTRRPRPTSPHKRGWRHGRAA